MFSEALPPRARTTNTFVMRSRPDPGCPISGLTLPRKNGDQNNMASISWGRGQDGAGHQHRPLPDQEVNGINDRTERMEYWSFGSHHMDGQVAFRAEQWLPSGSCSGMRKRSPFPSLSRAFASCFSSLLFTARLKDALVLYVCVLYGVFFYANNIDHLYM